MGRAPCCDKANVKKGPWSPEEDSKLKEFIEKHGTGGNWIALPHKAGLKRCGKSCRLRWLNYLRPNIKHGEFSDEEDRIICTLFASIGSRWSVMASQLPGRTDNDIKNYWNTKLKKKLLGPNPSQRKLQQSFPSSVETASSTKSHNGFQGISTSSSLLNTSTILEGHGSLVSPLLNHHHHYQVKDNFLMFGGEQSCSSSDGSCNQIGYGKEIDFEYVCGGGGEQMGLESYVFSGFGDDQKLLFGGGNEKGNGFVGEGSLVYNFEEIKPLVNSNAVFNNSSVVDDGGAVRGNKAQERVMYYY